MKKFLLGSAAVSALVAVASPAAAQTDTRHYAATVPVFGNLTSNNPGPAEALAWGLARSIFGIGTRYTAEADAPSNTTPVTPTVTVNFALTGQVEKDCSFYSGNNASATNIDFGVIGVRTGNNENVGDAFEMVDDAEAEIETLTAGCNFNNRVTVAKNSALGLVNQTASGYDNTQFQNNIPYTVQARWRGVTSQTSGAAPSNQSVSLSTGQLTNNVLQGAWRSAMDIDIVAPAAPLGLVAGNYTGTMTLTLAAL